MLQAKVKSDYRFGNSLQAFSRVEFIKQEWRDVPAGFEDQARAHEWLEVREREVVNPGGIETVAPAKEIDEELPTSENILDEILGEDQPSADQQLEELAPDEEVRKTRRGRKAKEKSGDE